MADFITMGETMVAFCPTENAPLRYVGGYNARIAGAESNVAQGVSKLGVSAGFITAVGDDEFGKTILNSVRAEGVDCSGFKVDKTNPTGIMFKEFSSGETRVFYYRANSAASHYKAEDLNEEYIANAKILHLTGITPVLSKSCEEAVLKAVEIAKKNGVLVSFDPNIRKKLWKDTDYSEIIRNITLSADIVEMGADEGEVLFGTADVKELIAILQKNNSDVVVAIKCGADGAFVAKGEEFFEIPPHKCSPIDPIGAGDAYNAGFLAGILHGYSLKKCGTMGGICGAMATEVVGDCEGQPSIEKIQSILSGDKVVYR